MFILKTILQINSNKAREFFLRSDVYSTLGLPKYFNFQQLLKNISESGPFKNEEALSNIRKLKKINHDVNHTVLINKDGKLSWRPISILNPVLYIDLVHYLTTDTNWKKIQRLFQEFQSNNILCKSIPVYVSGCKNSQGQQVLHWWEEIEQESIALALDYEFMFEADIADCYSSIYTHSIEWAVDGRTNSKQRSSKKSKSLGAVIDEKVRLFQQNQTNGIPQGSILMDFIAEIVLGSIDNLLATSICNKAISEYKILRYRDDYRIFVNKRNDGEVILKSLVEIMTEYGLKLNSNKTKEVDEIILGSIKPYKLDLWRNPLSNENIFRELVLIKEYSLRHPNSGGVVVVLNDLLEKIKNIKEADIWKYNIEVMVSIVTNIMISNPRAIAHCSSIISYLLRFTEDDCKTVLGNKIFEKFKNTLYTNYMEIWLQRIFINPKLDVPYEEVLCKIANKDIKDSEINGKLWDFSWVENRELQLLLEKVTFFDVQVLEKMSSEINVKEVSIFGY